MPNALQRGLLAEARPTPRNKLMGLLADALTAANDYAQAPDPRMPGGKANPVLGLLADGVSLNSLATTAQRASYGEPLTNAGKANTPFLRPETADALMMAPLSPRNALAALGMVGDTGMMKAALMAAPRADALKVAQRNAAKPIAEGGLGLRPDNTPMERAQAMGFDTELLHGTTNDFPAFSESTRHSTYATQDPAIADIYATATNRHKALREVNAGPNVIPLLGRGRLLETSDYRNGSGGWMQNNMADALGVEPKRGLTKELPAYGYDGAKVTMDDLGGPQTQFIYPDPKVLRSRFAAFDPFLRNSSNLLAGVGAGGLGLSFLLGSQRGND